MKRWQKIIILAYLSLLFFGSFLAVGALWVGAMEQFIPYTKGMDLFLYYFFAGAIGGSLRHLYMFSVHYMNDQLTNPREWMMYILYPIFATGTAVVAVTLIHSGILMIEFVDTDEAPLAQISIAFFVGFGFNRFLNRLNTISQNMFKTNQKSEQKIGE